MADKGGKHQVVRLVLFRLSESYFRHRWRYLLPLGLMALVATYAFLAAKPEYISRSVMYVRQESFLASLTSVYEDAFSWVTPAQATANELGELLQTDAFIRSLVLLTDLEAEMNAGPVAMAETLEETRDEIWVEVLGDNLVLVSATSEEPQLAQQLVNATIETFIQWKIQADREGSVAAQTFFATLIETYEADVELARQAMEDYLSAHPVPVRGERPEIETLRIDQLQATIDLASTRLANALNKEEEARLAMSQAESDARQTYLLIDAPRLPLEPERSLKAMLVNTLIFMSAGVILSATGIVGSALLDRSLRFPIDVRHELDLPVLASVPAAVSSRRGRTASSADSDQAVSTPPEAGAPPETETA